MTQFKYIKKGVKRQHQILEDLLPILEEIAKIDGIKKVIPAKISYSPKRGIGQSYPAIKLQRETISGFKLLAHGKGSIQEIFIIVDKSKKEEIKNTMKVLFGHFCD